MELTRRRAVASAAGFAGIGALAGCVGGAAEGSGSGQSGAGPTAQASFFVFGTVASRVAGDATETGLLVPVGQHGHGWEPGPRVREDVRDAALLVHGMKGFQPWVDGVVADLAADGADVATVDASAGLDLLAIADGVGHDEHDGHDGQDDHEEEAGHGPGDTDPHFWMDPLRVRDATETVREALSEVDPDAADAHADNAAAFREDLTDLHKRIESLVADADDGVLLVAGHDSFRYLGERYGLEVESLTGLAPEDQPTTRDIERAQEVIEEHGLRYVCADPLESQRAADQLVEETGAEAVLPLTAMPGLTDEWAENEWGYLDVMETVNLPTLERALTR